MSDDLEQKLSGLPTKSGVYQFKNEAGDIIYVGKAKSLRNRVRQYFQKSRPVDAKTKALVKHIRDVEVMMTDSNVEALILENTLIKEHAPKYNILLKDDKTFPYIRVTNEPYPRIFSTRTIVRDGSKYFGPYTSAGEMKYMLKTIRSMLPIRSCDYMINEESIRAGKVKVCLDYQIGNCLGPCEGHISEKEYNEHILHAVNVLKGKSRYLEDMLQEKMMELALAQEFEQAAQVKSRWEALKRFNAKQKVVSTDPIDRDVMSLARTESDACVVIFKVRDGHLIGKQHCYLNNSKGKSTEELLRSTFERWYLEGDDVPAEICVSEELEEMDVLQQWLSGKRGTKVDISVPKIGDKASMLRLVQTNAEYLLRELEIQRLKRERALHSGVAALQESLHLTTPPRRIDCFDNSHFQGSETVSSLVVFVDGKPRKSEYRKYKNKTVEGIDDFASMREVLHRRYSRMLAENADRPDLIIVDGGKGQLSSAVEVLSNLNVYPSIQVIGLAKRLEEVFLPGVSDSILIPKTSPALKMIQHLRDEAHRFAITFHRDLRRKRTLRTDLTRVPGVGEKTATKLLQHFGSVAALVSASPEELQRVAGKKVSENIRTYFSAENAKEDSSEHSDLDSGS